MNWSQFSVYKDHLLYTAPSLSLQTFASSASTTFCLEWQIGTEHTTRHVTLADTDRALPRAPLREKPPEREVRSSKGCSLQASGQSAHPCRRRRDDAAGKHAVRVRAAPTRHPPSLAANRPGFPALKPARRDAPRASSHPLGAVSPSRPVRNFKRNLN